MKTILNSKYYEQVSLLIDLIPLFSHDQNFAIKGGTAINLFLFDMPRLSVDIDLCYLPLKPREQALADIKQFINNLSKKINTLGFRKREKQSVNGFESTLFIQSKAIEVKIEINLVVRGSVYKPVLKSLVPKASNIFKREAEILCLNINDLFAGKICAAIDRQHPRDFFDLYMYFKEYLYSKELHQAFMVYLLSSKRPISELLRPNFLDIRKSYDTQFYGMTDLKIEYETLEETRNKIFDIVSGSFSEQDKEFLLSFKSGKPNWSLFPIEQAQHFPAVKWKLYHTQNMSQAKRAKALSLLEEKLG